MQESADPLHQLQLAREQRDRERTEDSHRTNERRLKALGRESQLAYGRQLYRCCHDRVAERINAEFVDFLEHPTKAAAHRSCLPMFERFNTVDHIAAVALRVALDTVSHIEGMAKVQARLGRAIEDEHRAMVLSGAKPLEFRRLAQRQGLGRKVVRPYYLAQLRVPIPNWTPLTRQQIGAFLLQVLIETTELFEANRQRLPGGRHRWVVSPSAKAEEVMRLPSTAPGTIRTPMLCPPRPWPGLFGGGHLLETRPLVKLPPTAEKGQRELYQREGLGLALPAVNHLQAVPWRVDADMVALQREAWEAGIKGLFPCSRAPLEVSPYVVGSSQPGVIQLRIEEQERKHRDLVRNRRKRIRIERSLQMAEELAGEVIHQAHFLDWRGRIYTASRHCSHQGPDHVKAQLEFAQAERVGDVELDWLLRSAAGYWGLSKATWEERLHWGQSNLARIRAAAEAPLDRLETWRDAKDPWQFLQAARAIERALRGEPVGTPIRFDQCCSGIGHLSALVRDAEVARFCNLIGDSPLDLYEHIRGLLYERLEADLNAGVERMKDRALAEFWLKRTIPRSLVKGPVLGAPYGASKLGVTDAISDWLDEELGYVDVPSYPFEVAVPAAYLTNRLLEVLAPFVAPARAVRQWLVAIVRKVVREGEKPLEWTAPGGFPMRVAPVEQQATAVPTRLFGRTAKLNLLVPTPAGRLDHAEARSGISANFTHSIDAAFLALVVTALAEHAVPVGTIHDCLAVRPHEADHLCNTIHQKLWEFYLSDHLKEMRLEIQATTGIALPPPPLVGTLDLAEIGCNPYAFC